MGMIKLPLVGFLSCTGTSYCSGTQLSLTVYHCDQYFHDPRPFSQQMSCSNPIHVYEETNKLIQN